MVCILLLSSTGSSFGTYAKMLNTYNQMIYSYVDKTPLIAIFIFSFVIAKFVVNERCGGLGKKKLLSSYWPGPIVIISIQYKIFLSSEQWVHMALQYW